MGPTWSSNDKSTYVSYPIRSAPAPLLAQLNSADAVMMIVRTSPSSFFDSPRRSLYHSILSYSSLNLIYLSLSTNLSTIRHILPPFRMGFNADSISKRVTTPMASEFKPRSRLQKGTGAPSVR